MSNDLEVVLQAADLLRQRPEITFVLIGDGKEKPELMTRAASMGLTNVKFLPPAPKLEMPEVLAAADACIAILKSIPAYKTVYPNKVFDYMAAARPVILSIDGVIRDLIEEVSAGLPIPPGSPNERASAIAAAVCQLADQPDTGYQMGLRGRKYVEIHLDRAKLAGELETLFKNLVHFMNTKKS
jgi:glycosyltransferase involved in cell wall biosynthesis